MDWRDSVVKPFNEQLANNYPFNPRSAQDASLDAFERFFKPDGILDTFYQQKMALESLTDYLHRNKEQENGMFGRAAAWMEGILTMMDGFTDAAADENAFSYPARDENDRHLDSRFNDVLDQYPQASA